MASPGTKQKKPNRTSGSSPRSGGRDRAGNERRGGLDDRAKRELAGVAIGVLGIGLMIAVLSRGTGAPVSALAESGRHNWHFHPQMLKMKL